MTQGDLEKIPQGMERLLRDLEVRIMEDMVRRIRQNAFSTASADWQFTRLQQLGQSEKDIKAWVKELLHASDEEIERIYSEDVYKEYMTHGRGYQVYGRQQIPFEDNVELQQLIEGVKQQTADQIEQITGSMGFVTKGYSGNLNAIQLSEYYQDTLDRAVMDLHSGAFDYSTVLNRTINEMTRSGLRWIDYESGWHNRVPVAARRAVMTGFRQVQGKINEQTARDLGTDSYEVTVHIGARPSHQIWEGKVYTMEQLHSVCGLGTGAGLHGWNCYHDYNAFTLAGMSGHIRTNNWMRSMKRRTHHGPIRERNIPHMKLCSARDSWRPGQGSTVRTYTCWKKEMVLRMILSRRNASTRRHCRNTMPSARRWTCRCRRRGYIRTG